MINHEAREDHKVQGSYRKAESRKQKAVSQRLSFRVRLAGREIFSVHELSRFKKYIIKKSVRISVICVIRVL